MSTRNTGIQSPSAQGQSGSGTGSNPVSNKGKNKATEGSGGAARSAARPTRNNPGDEPLAEGLPESTRREATGGESEPEPTMMVQPEDPPLLEEVRRLTNLLPGTPVANPDRIPGRGAAAQIPNEPVTPNNPGNEGMVVTPRHRQKEKVATDLISAKKLFKVINEFEGLVETQVTERRYDNLDELHTKQYRLETENATTVLAS